MGTDFKVAVFNKKSFPAGKIRTSQNTTPQASGSKVKIPAR